MDERRILLIDHDEDTREVYRLVLEHAGYRVWAAPDGPEGRRLAREVGPALVLCESRVMLPEGVPVHQAIRRDGGAAGPRVLIVTARGLPSELDEARASGADLVLAKPLSPVRLLAEVRRMLEGVESDAPQPE